MYVYHVVLGIFVIRISCITVSFLFELLYFVVWLT